VKKFHVLILAGLLVSPSVNAYDFGASAITAALAGGGVVLGAVVGAAPAIATVAIGAAIVGITFDQSPGAIDPGPVIQAQISPNAVFKTPPGWEDGDTPPDTTPKVTSYCPTQTGCPTPQDPGNGNWELTPQAACDNWSTTSTAVQLESGWHCEAAGPYYKQLLIGGSCPAGYVLSGDHCSLDNASEVTRDEDNVCVIKRAGNTFFADPQDPDCSRVPATVTVGPNIVSSSGPDGTNKNVTINSDGSATVTDSRPNTTINVTENNTTIISGPNGNGDTNVTGQGSGASNGTGTANTGTPLPQFDKSGLATEPTLSAIKGDTAAIKDSLAGTGDTTLNAQKSAFESAIDGLVSMFTGESARDSGIDDDLSFNGFLPNQCGCEPLTISYHNHNATFDWCPTLNIFKGVFEWVAGLLTAFYVLSLFRIGGTK